MSKATPGTLLLRALAIFSAVGMLTAWVVFRAVYAPKEKTRTRGSSSKAQNIASAYAAARAAGENSGPAPPDGNPGQGRAEKGFRMTLEGSPRAERWKPREDLLYLFSTKSGLMIEPDRIAGFFDDPVSAAKLGESPIDHAWPAGDDPDPPKNLPPAPLQTTDTPP